MWLSVWVMNVNVHYCVGLKNTSCVYSRLSPWAHEQQIQAPSKQTAQIPSRVTELWQTQLTLVMHPLPTACKPCSPLTLTASVFRSRFSIVKTGRLSYWTSSKSLANYHIYNLRHHMLAPQSVQTKRNKVILLSEADAWCFWSTVI